MLFTLSVSRVVITCLVGHLTAEVSRNEVPQVQERNKNNNNNNNSNSNSLYTKDIFSSITRADKSYLGLFVRFLFSSRHRQGKGRDVI